MKNNGTKWDLSKSPEVVHAMMRDISDIMAIVGVASGAVCAFALVVALAMQ
jgi:hypothetical protein